MFEVEVLEGGIRATLDLQSECQKASTETL